MFNAGFQVVKACSLKVNANVSGEHATSFYKKEVTLTLNVETMSLLNFGIHLQTYTLSRSKVAKFEFSIFDLTC
jgi:hypothetical protein